MSSNENQIRMWNQLIFFLILALSVVFGVVYNPKAPFTKKDLMRSMLSVSGSKPSSEKRIAVGLNANVDIVVNALDFFEKCNIPTPEAGEDISEIFRKEQLGASFLHHFQSSSAAERPVKEIIFFKQLVNCATNIMEGAKKAIGGNAAIMGQNFVNEFGFQVVLGGQVGKVLRELLPEKLDYIRMTPGKTAVANEPIMVSVDESHLILEYGKGETYGGSTATRANRFIVSSDVSNAALSPLEPLLQLVARSSKDDEYFHLLVLSGVHLLDAMEQTFWTNRLRDLSKHLVKIPLSTPIHFELASTANTELLKSIAQGVMTDVDSLGLNEVELATLYEVLGGEENEKLRESVPEPELVANAISHILAETSKQEQGTRTLARVHMHCLGYHIVAQRTTKAESAFVWKQDTYASAVAAGSVMATEAACQKKTKDLHGNDISLKLSKFKIDGVTHSVTEEKPVVTWEKDGVQFYLAPVLVCNKPESTVGLGDKISSTALAYQI